MRRVTRETGSGGNTTMKPSRQKSRFKRWANLSSWQSAERVVCDSSHRTTSPRPSLSCNSVKKWKLKRNPQTGKMKTGGRVGPLMRLLKMLPLCALALAFICSRPASGQSNEPLQPGQPSRPASKEKPFASMINSALINGRANLVCDIQAPSADDSVALVLWYKDDSLAPLYTLDARKVNTLGKAKISVHEQYANRLDFNLHTKPAQLELERLRQDDEGDFRCRVDFKRGRTVNTIISLRIIIPPSGLSLYMVDGGGHRSFKDLADQEQVHDQADEEQATGQVRQQQQQQQQLGDFQNKSLVRLPAGGLIGPFDEESELELVCLAHGGKPRPQLSWRRDLRVLNSTNFLPANDRDSTGVSLRLASLEREHLLSIFTCQASNNNLTGPLQSSITLDLNLRPQEVIVRQLEAHEGPLNVGQTTTFECVTSGSRPQATIHWLFQGQRHDSPMSVDQQHTSSKLSLVLQRSFNQQPLTCVAENPLMVSQKRPSSSAAGSSSSGTTQASSSPGKQATTIKLDVHYPPQLSVKLDRQSFERKQTPDDLPASTSHSPNAQEILASSTAATDQLLFQRRLQEGNDIYLTCHMDANPRPLKPIVWRFNGRPLVAGSAPTPTSALSSTATAHSQQGTIVINNNSLVLRKVSRHQSGSYTCEASNQHGTNTSRPFELVIRHAPVCQTDDILVYEAAPGQIVNIDCHVLANPARSAHFAWFLASSSPQQLLETQSSSGNLSNWLERDTSFDEQLDHSGGQLKFKVRDQAEEALIKCKAKNEIGLQQRVCLFQVVRAREPELHHSCALSGAGAQSLRLQCDQNEHLKTAEQQQHQRHSSSGSDAPSSESSNRQDPLTWMRNYDAMRHSLNGDSASSLGHHQLRPPQVRRQVYPPDWLLVELYRVTGNSSSDSAASTAAKQTDEATVNHELQSYVVVASGSEQLARIKSTVETNKLFQAQPRDIYYVIAKTSPGSNATRAPLPHDPASAAQDHEEQAQSLPIVKEPNLRLPHSFNFTVPNLEPDTRYKLLIFGQNLANKTRDWLVVRGGTSRESRQALLSSNNQRVGLEFDGEDQEELAQGKNLVLDQRKQDLASASASLVAANVNGGQPGLDKSLVMRGEQGAGQVNNKNELEAQDDEPARRGGNGAQGSSSASSLLTSGKLLSHFHTYKDHALAYAKQRPLFSIPLALAGFLALLLLLSYLSGLFVGLIRRRNQSLSGSGLSSSRQDNSNGSSDSSNFSSADSTTSRSSQHQQHQHQHQHQKQHPGGADSLAKSSSTLDGQHNKLRPQDADLQQLDQEQEKRRRKLEMMNCSLHQAENSYSSSVMSTSYNANNYQNAPREHLHFLGPAPEAQDELFECQANEMPYALSRLDAMALDEHQQQLMMPTDNWRHQLSEATNCGQMLGSLDRRGRFQPTIYLTETELGLHDGQSVPTANHNQHKKQQRLAAAGGSIDRRSLQQCQHLANGQMLSPPFTILHHHDQDQYQPLFLAPTKVTHGKQLEEHYNGQQPAPKSRQKAKSKSSMQSQHRVAFDLSNQQHGQQEADDEYSQAAAAHNLQLRNGPVVSTVADSSSGSNNSTAANTADSGHESPATTGGETNSCQSGGGGHQTAPSHHPHLIIGPTPLASVRRCREHNTPFGSNYQQQQQQQMQQQMQLIQLVEFPSPGSQESASTLLQSVDSHSFDATMQQVVGSSSTSTAAAGAHQEALTKGCSNLEEAYHVLPQNYQQIATSFTSGSSNSNQSGWG